jgi:opacity protein-like surface antigen
MLKTRLAVAVIAAAAITAAAPAAWAVPTSPFNLVNGPSYFRGNIAWNAGSYTVTGTLHTEGCLSVRTTGYAVRDGVPHVLNDSNTGPLCDQDRHMKATYLWNADFVRLSLNKGSSGVQQRIDRPAS